ncbi:hypothetical protein [Rhizobium sp. 2YAF20]|uniref:hypothetical protein n=1 Tax=Rhizobium sp. 2YAF20 TaxID=3233027 RepID=UPI003F968A5D
MKLIPSSGRMREDGITIRELHQHATRLNVPDRNTVYNKAGAKRHWKRLLSFFCRDPEISNIRFSMGGSNVVAVDGAQPSAQERSTLPTLLVTFGADARSDSAAAEAVKATHKPQDNQNDQN